MNQRVRLIGKCRCGGVAVEDVAEITVHAVIRGEPVSWKALRRDDGTPVLLLRCPGCARGIRSFRRVEGRLSPDIACGASCREASGWACSCSCAGAQHGVAHLVETARA